MERRKWKENGFAWCVLHVGDGPGHDGKTKSKERKRKIVYKLQAYN